MAHFDPIPSYSLENRYSITCPIFGANVEIRGCFHLRDLLWANKAPPTRRGCQACLHDSKCPIPRIVREVTHTGVDPGYFSKTEKQGALHARHVEPIRNIIVMDATLKRYHVSESEIAHINSVNYYNAPLKGSVMVDGKLIGLDAPIQQSDERPVQARRRRKPAEDISPKSSVTDDVFEAAISGDLGAAVTLATSK
jgi:hypothetical protein